MVTVRRRRIAFLLLLAFLSLYTLRSRFLPTFSPTSAKTTAIDSYALGSWQPRSAGPITNLTQLEALYPSYWWQDSTCPGGLERLYRIASWEWVSADGQILPWDGRRFVLDSLRRQGGIMLVGDSITWRHYVGINLLLKGLKVDYPGVREELFVEKQHETLNGQTLRMTLSLNTAHPGAAGFLEEAGVGEERSERPVMSFLRNDFFGATREVIDKACEEHGAEFQWNAQNFLFDWLSLAQEYTSEPSPYKTVLLLNTGMHFGMSPFVSRHDDDDLVYSVFDSIVKSTYTSIAALPNVQAVIRTSYPGEVDCNRTQPFTDVSESDINLWGWPRVAQFNHLLRTNFPLLQPTYTPPPVLRSPNSPPNSPQPRHDASLWSAPPLLLDVERQGQLRADGRNRPNGDCLHMCPTAIHEDWGRWMGMVMKGEKGWGS